MNSSERVLSDTVLTHGLSQGEKPCAIFKSIRGETPYTYADLRRDSLAVAAALAAFGVQPGQPVLIFEKTSPQLFAAFWGAMALGAVPAIMPPPTPKQKEELYWSSHVRLFERIGPAALLVNSSLIPVFSNRCGAWADRLVDLHVAAAGAPIPTTALPILKAADVAFLQHSSGTTALKKGVMLTHERVFAQLDRYGATIGFEPRDLVASWLPLYHDMGLITSFLMPLVAGATVVSIDPFEWLVRPAMLLEAVRDHRAGFSWMPNFAFAHLVNVVVDTGAHDLSSLRMIGNCSEPCKLSVHEAFTAHFAPSALRPEAVQVCYAMAENVFAVSQTPTGSPARAVRIDRKAIERNTVRFVAEDEPGLDVMSCGRLLSDMWIRLVDDQGRDVGEGQAGEIVIAGPSLFEGYLALPERTAEVLHDDGYHTRDLGFVVDDELFVLGRVDDLIIAYGRNFMAHEIEATVSAVDGIKPGRVVAFGLDTPGASGREMAVLFELLDGTEPTAAVAAVRRAIDASAGLLPRYVEVAPLGSLKKTTSGKISRSLNRAEFERSLEAFKEGAQ